MRDFGRADVREEVELHAKLAGGIDAALLARRILEMIDGPEDDAGRVARGFHDVIGQRRAAASSAAPSPISVDLPFEAELEFRVGAVEHGERRVGDLGADAVAGKDEDFHTIEPVGLDEAESRGL